MSQGFDALTTEGRDSRLADLDLKSTLDLVLLMNDRDAAVAPAVRRVAPEVAALVDGVSGRLSGGGRLVYAGAGSAGRLGQLDAVECPPTFGLDEGRVVGLLAGGGQAEVRATEEAEDDPRAGVDDLRAIDVGSGDAVVAISASGRTPTRWRRRGTPPRARRWRPPAGRPAPPSSRCSPAFRCPPRGRSSPGTPACARPSPRPAVPTPADPPAGRQVT